jgi:2-oxoglutarate dehydrogenase E1 component
MADPTLQFHSHNLPYIEDLYARFLNGDSTVPAEWANYFRISLNGSGTPAPGTNFDPPFASRSVFNPPGGGGSNHFRGEQRMNIALRQERVDQLIQAYRSLGHISAKVDPLKVKIETPTELDHTFYGFSESDLDREVSTELVGGPDTRTLRGVIAWLKQTYCRSIGVQYMHIESLQARKWLQQQMETTANRLKLSVNDQKRILERLADAVCFEKFLWDKFKGEKTFSLDGGETLIPLLDQAIEWAAELGTKEIVMAMAHRGRLNVLYNTMGKMARQIFREIEDQHQHLAFDDVKYHLGYSSNRKLANGKNIHLSLCFNPSHLEFVNPIAMGRVRAKMDSIQDHKREHGCCVLIHGDAAFIGEGVTQETLNLSELYGYKIGGVVHIIVNNQIGFTTSAREGRSCRYTTDIAKMLDIPIFHVNGEDPEAVAQVVKLAMEFRARFQKDVVIDMYCFRRRGHNELDEPRFTNPMMYKKIDQKPSVYESYKESLINYRGVTADEATEIWNRSRSKLDAELTAAHDANAPSTRDDDAIDGALKSVWKGYFGGAAHLADHVNTGRSENDLSRALTALSKCPDDFVLHPTVQKVLDKRREMALGNVPLDWGAAEMLAYGTLLEEGHPFRMSGQDVRRGTFSHRHAVLVNVENGNHFSPLRNIEPRLGWVHCHNSPLSEIGVLGFEYGYSLDTPHGTVVWEAQFGDFANVAQVIIDQFIASSEMKWRRLSGITLLLPHGYEGNGPEHSSARLERFLNLAAEDNMQIVQPSTPAQMFHLLRRQVLRKWKKPLIVMTPKQLLRLPACVSALSDCAKGTFQPVIGDSTVDAKGVKRLLLCSGRVYYDLLAERTKLGRSDVAIVRVEEFYPLPVSALENALKPYKSGIPTYWVQDEPENMGGWRFLLAQLGEKLFDRFDWQYIGRKAAASPSTGSHHVHHEEQEEILHKAFG